MLHLVHRSQKSLDTPGDSGAILAQPYSVHAQNHFFRSTERVFDSTVSAARMKAGSVINTKPWPTNPRSLLELSEQRSLAPASWAGGMRTPYSVSVSRFPPLWIATREKQRSSFGGIPKQRQSRPFRELSQMVSRTLFTSALRLKLTKPWRNRRSKQACIRSSRSRSPKLLKRHRTCCVSPNLRACSSALCISFSFNL